MENKQDPSKLILLVSDYDVVVFFGRDKKTGEMTAIVYGNEHGEAKAENLFKTVANCTLSLLEDKAFYIIKLIQGGISAALSFPGIKESIEEHNKLENE